MQFKLYKFEENFEETKLNDSIIEHCEKYTDFKMRKISKFAYLKMLELVEEVFDERLYDEPIIFEGKPHFSESKIFFNITHEDDIIV